LNSKLSFLKGRARFQNLADCRSQEEFIEGKPEMRNHHFLKRHLGILPTVCEVRKKKAGQTRSGGTGGTD
jgi:hypothetical protein